MEQSINNKLTLNLKAYQSSIVTFSQQTHTCLYHFIPISEVDKND